MRLNVRSKFVTAKERFAAKKRIAFALEIEIFRKPGGLITMALHPFYEMRRFTGALFVTKVAGNEFFPNGQACVCRENHIGQFWLRWHQMDGAAEFQKRGM